MEVSTLQEWAETLPLSSILAACITPSKRSDSSEELNAICELSTEAIKAIGKEFAEKVTEILIQAASKFKEDLEDTQALQANTRLYGSSKFCHEKSQAVCGEIKDFHRTLTDRVGWPNLDFLKGMTDEHIRGASFYEKYTGKEIFPKKEFEYVKVGKDFGYDPKAGNMRIIPNVDELWNGQTAKAAKLSREEVVATVLYTGPMFHAYNEALRGTTTSEDKYSTTIFLLGSAVTKLSKVQHIPRGIRLYRGYGKDFEFPKCFLQPDTHGCQGITEFGFLSTTESKKIAIQYSGAKKAKRIPMIIEIAVGSVDRGANIREFSQYPHEDEYLWTPCSFLEPIGRPFLDVADGSVVAVIRVRANCNLKTMTTDQLVSTKKSMHLAAFNLLILDVKHSLMQMAPAIEQRLEQDDSLRCDKHGVPATEPICTSSTLIMEIVGQCFKVREQHELVDESEYVLEKRYKNLVCAMLETATMARSKLLGWLEDKSRRICHDLHSPLMVCHRERLSYLFRTMPLVGPNTMEMARKLCMEMGLIVESLDETNDLDEGRLVAGVADGRSSRELKMLLAADGDVNREGVGGEQEGVTAVFAAARFGQPDSLLVLFEARADITIPNKDGRTPLWIAARNGHLDCAQLLLNQKADVNAVDNERSSPAWVAAQRGHEMVLRLLQENGANLDAADSDGCTPSLVTSYGGHAGCLQFLIDSAADVKQANHVMATPLTVAAQQGHAACLGLLIEAQADVSAPCEDGWTPVYSAAHGGRIECVRLLHAAKADIYAGDKQGVSPEQAAAAEGHAECAELLRQLAAADAAAGGCAGSPPKRPRHD
jgi:ankyrin repeat protein